MFWKSSFFEGSVRLRDELLAKVVSDWDGARVLTRNGRNKRIRR